MPIDFTCRIFHLINVPVEVYIIDDTDDPLLVSKSDSRADRSGASTPVRFLGVSRTLDFLKFVPDFML